ncbi:hypothetical protein MHAS44199_04275 [Mycolicibacterium hassiacum DSM 44199]|nr:hypothetical protein [Mycolicibacterium hassiacum DSM 44199]
MEKSAKSNPGTTTQLTRQGWSSRGRARCQCPGGTTICGCCPAVMSAPSTCVVAPSCSGPNSSSSGPPKWYSHNSALRTVCHADCWPGMSKNRMAVPALRGPL